MQYKENTKIIIDKRKLDTLFRLGVDERLIVQLLRTGTFERTKDTLINDNLEALLDIKTFTNWGGDRKSKNACNLSKKNQLENQDENQLENQDDRQVVDKDKDIDIDIDNKKTVKRFIKPELEEIKSYCKERGNKVNPEHFFDYYESNGWKVGKNSMKDWKASVRTWERNCVNNKEKADIISKELKLFCRFVVDTFEKEEVITTEQKRIWFNKNYEKLRDILAFCDKDIERAMFTIQATCDWLDENNLQGGYEAVLRHLPEMHSKALKRINNGERWEFSKEQQQQIDELNGKQTEIVTSEQAEENKKQFGKMIGKLVGNGGKL